MKLLLCVSDISDISPVFEQLSVASLDKTNLPFLFSAKILHHEVYILLSGFGLFQTSYKMTKALESQKYHLALKLSLANSYNEAIPVGAVLNIVNDKPGDFGMMIGEEWKDFYDLQLLNREEAPHVRGGFVNLNNSYMNVFMPFKKVVGLTVNGYANSSSYKLKKERYKAECETGDGLGFVYPCLFENQNYYHLGVIERNLATGKGASDLAKKVLQESLKDILTKL